MHRVARTCGQHAGCKLVLRAVAIQQLGHELSKAVDELFNLRQRMSSSHKVVRCHRDEVSCPAQLYVTIRVIFACYKWVHL